MPPAEATSPTETSLWSASQIVDAVRSRAVSPVELVEQLIERIERLQGSCNAFVEVYGEQALRSAAAVEREVMRAQPQAAPAQRPLLGVPVAIKDLSDTKRGWRNTRGSQAFAATVAQRDSLNVERLQAAGAILVGTTNTAELGHKCITDNPLNGPTSTPFAAGYNAGGSSGGSAAAVAAGMAAAATGTDGAGSLRVPASYCGVFTLKPTFGRMPTRSRPNGFNAAWPLAQGGVLTRSVADAVMLMDVLAQPDRSDPLCQLAVSEPPSGISQHTFDALVRERLDGLRVGYCADWGGFPIDPEVSGALQPMLTELERMGATVEPVERPHELDVEQLNAIIRRAVGLMLADVIETQVDPVARDQLDRDVRELAAGVQDVRALQVRQDDHVRTALFDGLQAQLSRHDVLVGPAVGTAGVRNATDGRTVGPSEIAGRSVDPLLSWCPAYLLNLTGHPAACVPAGTSAEGVPIGLQLVGERHSDATLLAIAAVIEHNRPWAASYAQL